MAREAQQYELDMKKLELFRGNLDQKNESESKVEPSHRIQLTQIMP
ncbi:hypothetical protein NPIL_365311, partial [Nephila pilipes]